MIVRREGFKTRGFTLVETMLSLAVTLIIMAMFLPIFRASSQGFVSSELQNGLKETDQSIMNHMAHNLVQCKRIFEKITDDNFLSRTGVTTALTGSVLPVKNENGVLSPTTAGFDPNQVGNSLFIARFDVPIDMVVTSTIPCAVAQPPCTAAETANGNGVGYRGISAPIRLDAYRFDYYYLAPMGTGLMMGVKEALNLWEWESLPYVDYGEIQSIQNFTKSTGTVSALYSMGYRYGWLASTKSANYADYAFYTFYSSGTTSRDISHLIRSDRQTNLVKVLSVVAGKTTYGVSPNSGSQPTRNPVPMFATATSTGNFPGGFEVMVVGSGAACKVFTRLVLMAHGSDKIIRTNENFCLTSTRDLW